MKRSAPTAGFASDVKRLVTTAQERELQFVTNHLKTNPQMTAMAAELLEALQEVLEALQQEDMENGFEVNLVKWAQTTARQGAVRAESGDEPLASTTSKEPALD